MKDEDLMDLVNKPKGKANPFHSEKWDDPFAGDNPPGRLPTKTDALAQDILANPAPAPKPAKAAPRPAKRTSDFDALQAEIAKYEASKKEGESVSRPPTTRQKTPQEKRSLQEKIDRGMLPQKSGWATFLESLGESNTAAGQSLMDRTAFGLPGKAARALGVYGAPVAPVSGGTGKYRRLEDWLPNEEQVASVPAAAMDMLSMGGLGNAAKYGEVMTEIPKAAPVYAGGLSKAGETLGQIPQAIARKLGASEAQTAVRPALQTMENAAASGALYGGFSGAARNENLSELPEDIGSGMVEGAAGNALMSSIPAGFSALRDAGQKAVTSRAVRPLVGIGQGQKANKAQAGLGKGDVELGEQEIHRIVEQEGLAPIINGRNKKLQKRFNEKLAGVWDKELGPVRETALKLEPDAKVQWQKIEAKLNELVGKDSAGTDVHDDVKKAIALLKERMGNTGSKAGFPVRNLLKNAQEFEQDGFGKSQPKFADGATARAIGRTLRDLTDERISGVYVKHPEAVRDLIGAKKPAPEPRYLETGEENPNYWEPKEFKPKGAKRGQWMPWEKGTKEEQTNLEVLGDKYAAARKRYSDLKQIEPLIDQLATRRSQDRPGFGYLLKHGLMNTTAGMLGYGVGGQHGMALGLLGSQLATRGLPYAERATAAIGRVGAGPAVDPWLSGAIAADKVNK